MNETVLSLAALLLAVFCLIYSITARRELYSTPQTGLAGRLRSQHTVFLIMLGALAVSAGFSAAGGAAYILHAEAGTLQGLRLGCFFFHLLLSCCFALYILNLTGQGQRMRTGALCLLSLPLLLGEILVLTNPLTSLCITIDEGLETCYGTGFWILYAIAAFYIAAGIFVFGRFGGSLSRTERRAMALLILGIIAGAVIQLVWEAPVELFFEAVVAYGFMVLMEHDSEASESSMSDRFRGRSILVVLLVFFLVIVMNVVLIQKQAGAQYDKIGSVELNVLRSELQDTIAAAEGDLLHVAMHAEEILAKDDPQEELAEYFDDQHDSLHSDASFMNIYIAGSDWHIIPGFDAPPDFHASERVWYLGAMENPGEIYISEPYKDADTGNMCFTVSTLLSDGETVVGMDLNFSKAQETILQMTSGGDQTAMIVTDSGQIVGYSDMSLVGEQADEKLPEYAEVIQRVISSQEHESFRAKIDGRSCIVFSSETSNHWNLILSVGTDTLYAESYQQIAMMLAVNLLMLLVVGVFYMLSTRNRRRAAAVLEKNRNYIDDVYVKLRVLSGRVLRLSDERLIREGEKPEVLAGQIRESGQELSALVDNINSYAESLRLQEEETEKKKEKKMIDSTEAPSRKVRTGVIITLLLALFIVLFFCIRITDNWGDDRLKLEASTYENQLDEWITEQQTILYMATDMISADPSLMDDYDEAVEWLNDIAEHYPNISACYMTNPYAEIPVIMNTGWIPGDDYRPETRPWYKAAEQSANRFSISAPYFDAQTGNYCITFSRVVYGENNEFLGVFGIDFFLDKLINVLGESYTSTSYAFLVDADGMIVNHPNKAYENGDGTGVSVEDTEYAEAYNTEKVVTLRDYTGHLVSCYSCGTESGFTVMVAIRWWSIFGNVVLMTIAFLMLFGFCIAFIVLLINRLIRWQGDVNRQLVEAANAARNADRAKSHFLAQMSHEIRTPMNAIIGLDNIALRDPGLSDHTREELEKIGASAQHLLALINDILDMSRIESGRMELKAKEFPLRDFLEQINVIINGQCEDKGLRYECDVIGTPDPYFVGDDLKLKQVLINILGNSVKFTDAPGSVFFSVEQTDDADDRCSLVFKITDTGIGMDKEFMSRLFEAFSQEDGSTTNRYGGSGLGMAITKNIVGMMGGDILVESEKGVGSTFTVTVPMQRTLREDGAKAGQGGEAEGADNEAAEEFSVAGLHVLIAEDNELNAEILTDLLEMEDISSEWAENGQIAVDMFAQSEAKHFDAVLMDMRMPVMDGLAATRGIRGLDHPDAQQVPIIALTANAFEEDVQQCLEAGMDAHMSKPVDIDLLKVTLGQLHKERSGKR